MCVLASFDLCCLYSATRCWWFLLRRLTCGVPHAQTGMWHSLHISAHGWQASDMWYVDHTVLLLHLPSTRCSTPSCPPWRGGEAWLLLKHCTSSQSWHSARDLRIYAWRMMAHVANAWNYQSTITFLLKLWQTIKRQSGVFLKYKFMLIKAKECLFISRYY